MPRALRITQIAVHRFGWDVPDLGVDYNGFNHVYQAGSCLPHSGYVLTVTTDAGIVGEYVGGTAASYAQVGMMAEYLLGRDPLQRELIYNDLKRALRKHDRMGLGPVDIALWDIAGKLYDAPISQLLGGFRRTLPAYASTYHGDDNGGLSTPEAFADFAVRCRDMGYPACEYNTWSDALKVGLACDQAGYLWLEDPYKDGGTSAFGHRKLRQIIKTPILLGEHIRGHELHVDNIVGDGTDFVRADADYDCGITGLMKIAHSAEGFGLDVEIHAPGPAHRHCMPPIRNTNYYELGLVPPRLAHTKPPVYACDYSDELDAVDKHGHVKVPEGPGLGVPIDWDWLRAHQTDEVVYE